MLFFFLFFFSPHYVHFYSAYLDTSSNLALWPLDDNMYILHTVLYKFPKVLTSGWDIGSKEVQLLGAIHFNWRELKNLFDEM